MTDTIKKVLMAVAAIAALALGGSAIAGAVSGDSDTTTQQSDTATQDDAQGSESEKTGDDGKRPEGGQRSDETLLTGSTEAQVTEAALAEVPGGTIERVETDADGNAAYEAHMTTADGDRVTVYVDDQFSVVSVDESGGHGPDSHERDDQTDADRDANQSPSESSLDSNA